MAVIVVFCTVYALVLPAITLSDEPICGQQVHTHTDSCYRTQIYVPDCGAVAHIHDETCEDALGNPACGFGERMLHGHTEVCYDRSGTLICQLPELQEHIHSEACSKTERKLICDLEEIPEHNHNRQCYGQVLVCTQEELTGHNHIDSCYDDTEMLICIIPAHTHDVSCKVPAYDPQADVEKPEDWEKTFENLSLTGRGAEDLLTIAVTQLGYRESKQNVVWNEDGSVKGYTRYGAWYGAPYIMC